MTIRETRRIPVLDGWRGIAILLVLVDHLNDYSAKQISILYGLGQHGVLIFFVLSGYLITSRLLQEREQTGRISLGAFYMRRFFRLMPAAWIYLLVCSLLHLMPAIETWSALFFWRNFETSASSAFGIHFWSLSLEEQYYLVWPAVFIFLGRRRACWIAFAGACSVAAWRSMHTADLTSQSFVYSLATQYRADSLLLGCAAALVGRRWRIEAFDHKWMLGASLIGIAACMPFFHVYGPIGESALIAFVIWSTAHYPERFRGVVSILGSRALSHIGLMSYSLYVWQQLALAMLPHANALQSVLKLLTLGTLASISFYVVERPMIRFGSVILRTRAEQGSAVKSLS